MKVVRLPFLSDERVLMIKSIFQRSFPNSNIFHIYITLFGAKIQILKMDSTKGPVISKNDICRRP